jgi:hypothetical protein
MLKLPLCEGEGGCNFATTDFICDITSGISAILYKPELIKNKGHYRFKDHFVEFMEKYYPWKEEGLDPQEGTKIIYEWMRHPITHRLGIVIISQEQPVSILKLPLNNNQIRELEDLSKEINLKTIEKKNGTYSINVLGLYRGVHKMLKSLFRDENRMQQVNEFLMKLLPYSH